MLQKPFSVSREQFCLKTFQIFEESLRKFPLTFLLNVFLQPLNLDTARAPVQCSNSELCYAAFIFAQAWECFNIWCYHDI